MTKVEEVRALYKQGMGWKEFFDALAQYQRPMKDLTADRAVEISGLAYETVVAGFKQLAQVGIGEFKYGRRGGKTRIEWAYSPGSVGRVALGTQSDLEAYSDEDEIDDEIVNEGLDQSPLSLISASTLIERIKRQLAQQLEIDIDQIEIAIRW